MRFASSVWIIAPLDYSRVTSDRRGETRALRNANYYPKRNSTRDLANVIHVVSSLFVSASSFPRPIGIKRSVSRELWCKASVKSGCFYTNFHATLVRTHLSVCASDKPREDVDASSCDSRQCTVNAIASLAVPSINSRYTGLFTKGGGGEGTGLCTSSWYRAVITHELISD